MGRIETHRQDGQSDNLTSNQVVGGSSSSGCTDNTPSDRGISLLLNRIGHYSTCFKTRLHFWGIRGSSLFNSLKYLILRKLVFFQILTRYQFVSIKLSDDCYETRNLLAKGAFFIFICVLTLSSTEYPFQTITITWLWTMTMFFI